MTLIGGMVEWVWGRGSPVWVWGRVRWNAVTPQLQTHDPKPQTSVPIEQAAPGPSRENRRPCECSGGLEFAIVVASRTRSIDHHPLPVTELRLKLFVAGDSPRAREAAANLARACDQFPAGDIEVETVDVLMQPQLADEYRVLTTPTVVRVAPLPRRRVTGDLRDAAQLMAALAIYPSRPAQ